MCAEELQKPTSSLLRGRGSRLARLAEGLAIALACGENGARPEASENHRGFDGEQPLNQALSSVEETMIIPLTEQQMQAVAASGETPPTLVDSHTQTTYVLIRKDLYERMTGEEYDDTPWTAEERHALAWEAGKHAGWEDMSDYDDEPEKP